jgi:hypothetical protein
MIEEKEYLVTLKLTLKSGVYFSPAERKTKITAVDAIDNALGMLLPSTWEDIRDNFIVDITSEAEEI